MELKKYKLLSDSLKAVKENTINLLILKGSAGFGKSYNVKKYLKENNISHKYITTYATPLSFYNLLYKNKDKELIIFDDITTTDKKITSILKSACNNLDRDRIIQWNSTTQILKDYELPEEFKLKANVILILNEDLPEFKPIINRAVTLNFKFNFEDKINILKEFQTNAKIENEVLSFIENNCNNATTNLSIRTAVILSNLKRAEYDWLSFADELLNTDNKYKTMQDLVQKCKVQTDFTTNDAVKEWVEKTGLSRRTYFNYLNKLKGGTD